MAYGGRGVLLGLGLPRELSSDLGRRETNVVASETKGQLEILRGCRVAWRHLPFCGFSLGRKEGRKDSEWQPGEKGKGHLWQRRAALLTKRACKVAKCRISSTVCPSSG